MFGNMTKHEMIMLLIVIVLVALVLSFASKKDVVGAGEDYDDGSDFYSMAEDHELEED